MFVCGRGGASVGQITFLLLGRWDLGACGRVGTLGRGGVFSFRSSLETD